MDFLHNARTFIQKFTISFSKKEIYTVIFAFLSFLIGQAVFQENINPFYCSFLILFIDSNPLIFLILLLSSIIGIFSTLSGIYLIKYLLVSFILLILSFYFTVSKLKLDTRKKAILSTVVIVLIGIFTSFFQVFSFTGILAVLFEGASAFCLVYIFNISKEFVESGKTDFTFGNYEILGFSLFLSIIFIPLNKYNIPLLNICQFITVFTILCVSFITDSSKSILCGFVLSFLSHITINFSIDSVIVFCLLSIFSGLFLAKSKIKIISSFFLVMLFSYFYISKDIFDFTFVFSTMSAVFVFMCFPLNVLEKYNTNFLSKGKYKNYKSHISHLAEIQIMKLSKSIGILSKSFNNLSKKNEEYNVIERKNLVELLTQNMCNSCAKKDYCFGSRYIYTCNNILDVLKDIENSELESDNIKNFQSYCILSKEFLENSKEEIKIFLNNSFWINKISENRYLTSQQIFYVANILEDFSKDVSNNLVFHETTEKILYDSLEKQGININNISVFENKDRLEITVDMPKCLGQNNCRNQLIKTISALTGRNMKISDYKKCSGSLNKCETLLKEDTKYCVTYGYSTKSKTPNSIIGDCLSVFKLENDEYIFAISDGMGTGSRANGESSTTISVLEEFLSCNFDKELSIRLANSILLQKNNKDKFATLDICTVNLFNGLGEFYKIGAVNTYILRKNAIYVINSRTLPIGILDEVDIEKTRKQFLNDDIVIMVTDGITDIAAKTEHSQNWLEDTILRHKNYTPQNLADKIISAGLDANNGVPLDDMTVLVFRVNSKSTL